MSLTTISVRGAREHNLKGFDIELPREKLIVITGLSGFCIISRNCRA